MTQLKYIYLCGFLMTSMSFAMKLEDVDVVKGPITTFPSPITRFAVTPDGEWLATSEGEVKYSNGYVSLLLRIWKKTSNEQYEEKKSGVVYSTDNPCDKDIKLHWLTDQQRIAILSCIPTKKILWAVHYAPSLDRFDDSQLEHEAAHLEAYYCAHGEDLHRFSPTCYHMLASVGTREDVNEFVRVTPTTICWQRYPVEKTSL